MTSARFFNDDPVDGTDEAPDLLGRQPYAEVAVQMLRRVREQSDSGVHALIGPWGRAAPFRRCVRLDADSGS